MAIVDPGAGADTIQEAIGRALICCILLTHGHADHIGALESVRRYTGAPVGIHPADAEAFDLEADFPLTPDMEVGIGRESLTVTHVPGHTPGSVCLRLNGQAIVGDAIFPGGPGYTASPQALAQSLVSLDQTVFTWPAEMELYPGHGGPTSVGAERADFKRFIRANHPNDLCGDVTWR
jgi:glyoxylase-like metal-dependent hydrolase (beta-lactamase superfamily II)